MQRIVATSLTLAASIAFGGLSATQAAGDRNYAGEYVMAGKGFGPADTAYTGTCSVTPGDHAYAVSCFNSDTMHTYVGKGIGQGETFAIFIGDKLVGDHGQVFTGEYLVVYQREANGVLRGVWTHADTPVTGAETLTPKP